MSAEFQYDVFLSHNSADKPRVRKLAERLKQAGLRVWLDEWVIKAGDDIYLAIERGLEAARVQVLCLSPAALGSEWVTLERSTVLFRDPTNQGRRFVPLLLADCTLPDTLRRYKYVDFRQETPAAFDELLAACREEVKATPPAPQPEPNKEPAKPIPKPVKTPEQVQPLAVFETSLTGHKAPVRCVVVSPDGKWVASGSDDAEITVWDISSGGKRQTSLLGHTGPVTCLASSPRGWNVLSGSEDGAVRIWDPSMSSNAAVWRECRGTVLDISVSMTPKAGVSLGDELRSVPGSQGREPVRSVVYHVAVEPGLSVLLARTEPGHESRIVARKKVAGPRAPAWMQRAGLEWFYRLSAEPLMWNRRWDSTILCAGTAPNANRVVLGDCYGRIWVWNFTEDEFGISVDRHSGSVNSIRITPDGRNAVSGSDDGTIKLWDLDSATCIGTLEGHRGNVGLVATSLDGALVASTGLTDHTIRLWDWKSGSCLQVIEGGDQWTPFCAAFSPDGSRLVVGTTEGTVSVFLLRGARPIPSVEATRRYVNAKIVLLGEGAVGKTSLAHRLIEDKYVVKDRTHGMNVWTLDLPQSPLTPALSHPMGEGGDLVDREALLWDLAGQEDYRLIHRLFLDETALALLLINPQKDDPFAEAGDWLKALDTAAFNDAAKRQAARLLIFSQTDVGGMRVSNAKIERFIQEHRFVNWLATSAKTGENCSDQANAGQPSKLKQLIADSVPWDKLPWTATPRLLAELKNALLKMRSTTDIRLLRFAELAQRLEQTLPGERFGESDVRTAVSLLANHGLARPLKFGDLVLLQPELLNGYAGAIIRSARAHKDEIGCVLEADIYDPKFDFTGVERLKHRPDEELLLRAMVQTFLDHSLCIAEDTPQGRHLVFPSQYRREKDIPRDPDIFVSYTFSGEWQTVWTTLVVRLWYSQEFAHRELWRNAAEFASPKKYTLGLKLTHKQGEGEATISLYFDKEVEDVLKAIFIEYVHRHLAKYACEVTRDRRYVCPECGKPVKDIEAVRKRLQAKKDFITCQECDERVPLLDFIEQRLKSDPIARKILAMDATATRGLDTQALEQILIGHMMAIAGEANQIFRPMTMFDFGIDGEVEFKDKDGKASGKKIYVQLKSGDSYLRLRHSDGKEIFDVQNERHLEYWVSQPVDVYLVIRQTDEVSGGGSIRWMNLTRYLKTRKDKQSRQIIFDGVKLDMEAVWHVRDEFFSPKRAKAGNA